MPVRFFTPHRDAAAAAAFLSPFMLLLAVFMVLPLALMTWDSFFSYSLLNPAARKFVGLGNYVRIFTDPATRNSFFVTLLFAAGVVAAICPIGLGIALFLNARLPARGLFRTIVLLPTVTSAVVVSTMWTFILHPSNGLLNAALRPLGLGPFDYLTSTTEALPSLIMVMVWQQVGLAAVVFLAGLQGIPDDIYDAARIDGASPLLQFTSITLPLLSRTTFFVVLMMIVFSLQAFAPVYLLTGGGPLGTTNLIVHHIYVTAFSFQAPGFASAICIALIAIALAISGLQTRFMRSQWSY